MQVKHVYKISNYKNIQVLSHPIPKLQVQVCIPSACGFKNPNPNLVLEIKIPNSSPVLGMKNPMLGALMLLSRRLCLESKTQC
jgi:hypothetical protein